MRRTLLLIAVCLALLTSSAAGQRVVYIQTQTVTNAVVLRACTTAGSTPTGCQTDVATNQLFCVVETAAIRWFANGTDPTTTTGNLANAGATIGITGSNWNVSRFRMIATASNATVTCNISRP